MVLAAGDAWKWPGHIQLEVILKIGLIHHNKLKNGATIIPIALAICIRLKALRTQNGMDGLNFAVRQITLATKSGNIGRKPQVRINLTYFHMCQNDIVTDLNKKN